MYGLLIRGFLCFFGYWAYRKIGLQSVKKSVQQQEVQYQEQQHKATVQSSAENARRTWKRAISQKAFTGSTHCTTDCTLGDVVGEWGIVFQYFSIIPMHKMMEGKQLSKKEGVKEAVKADKADTLSLIIYEIGLFIWMWLTQLVFFSPKLEPTQPTYWFMMQVGMALGLLTAYPANWWIVKKGSKYGM